LVRLSELGPTATGFYRVFLALPVLWLWTVLARRYAPAGVGTDTADDRPLGRRDYGLMALAGVFFAGGLGFWHWSLQFTSVANSTLLANFAVNNLTVKSALKANQIYFSTGEVSDLDRAINSTVHITCWGKNESG